MFIKKKSMSYQIVILKKTFKIKLKKKQTNISF